MIHIRKKDHLQILDPFLRIQASPNGLRWISISQVPQAVLAPSYDIVGGDLGRIAALGPCELARMLYVCIDLTVSLETSLKVLKALLVRIFFPSPGITECTI
jgi:hypothetical protein